MNLSLAFQFAPPDVNLALLAPELIVCLAGVLAMLVDAFAKPTQRWITGTISLAGLVAAASGCVWLWATWTGVNRAFGGMIVLDEMRLGFNIVFLLVSALTVLISMVWIENERLPAGEFH